jgi:hypothetical protein
MKKIKANLWGYVIIGIFIVFATAMISFGVVASRHKVNLVVDDYYKAEIDYQKQIVKMRNYDSLSIKPLVEYDSINKKIIVDWGNIQDNKLQSGDIYFYRPDHPDMDIKYDIETDGKTEIPLKAFAKGRWVLKINFRSDLAEYYTEKRIFLK